MRALARLVLPTLQAGRAAASAAGGAAQVGCANPIVQQKVPLFVTGIAVACESSWR
jgi:hypothetical protein